VLIVDDTDGEMSLVVSLPGAGLVVSTGRGELLESSWHR